MKNVIPQYARPFLWSYDIENLDFKRDKKKIITNILNLGTKQATDWLFLTYSKNDIIETIKDPLPGEWNDKSLNYWNLIFKTKVINPKQRKITNI